MERGFKICAELDCADAVHRPSQSVEGASQRDETLNVPGAG